MDQSFNPKLHSPGVRDELTQQKQENPPENGGGCRQQLSTEVLSLQTSNIIRSSCHDSFQTVTSCGLGATNNPTSSKTVSRHTFQPSRRHIRRRRRRGPPPWPGRLAAVTKLPSTSSFATTLAFTTVILLSSLATFTSAMKNEFCKSD